MTADDVTVLVPLHRSAEVAGIVDANLERLVGACRVVVSDATGHDDTFERLRSRWQHRDVEFLGPRPLAPGWVPHYDDLLQRATTEYVLWLPHDDDIDLDYVVRCRAALIGAPSSVGAFGRLVCVEGPGLRTGDVDLDLPPADPHRNRAEQLLFDWNLGIAFRSVFRRRLLPPLLPTNEVGEHADLVWLYGLVLTHDLVRVPEVEYRKRFHDGTAHSSWRDHPQTHTLVWNLREIDRRPELDGAADIARSLVAATARTAVETIDALDEQQHVLTERVADLERSLAEMSAGVADLDAARHQASVRAEWEAAVAEATRRSGAFRIGSAITAPVRALRRLR